MRSASARLALLVATMLAAGLAGPGLAHVHAGPEARGLAAPGGDAAGGAGLDEACARCTARAPGRHLAGARAAPRIAPSPGRATAAAPRPPTRAPRPPLRGTAPARAPPERA